MTSDTMNNCFNFVKIGFNVSLSSSRKFKNTLASKDLPIIFSFLASSKAL